MVMTKKKVWMLGKNTILKAIHNPKSDLKKMTKVWMLGKNTILKAIRNNIQKPFPYNLGVNAG